mmetsp:Transcript_9186/g.14261  ORF Transcript_9186/g.14261 Transcript_9186/m.14261 type:complete len:164 (+) Transcript_9186:138-629(+)
MGDFNHVIDTWTKNGRRKGAQRSQAILELAEQQQSPNIRPTTMSCGAVIKAWARSKEPDAGIHAEALLLRMKKRFNEGDMMVVPDAAAYKAVIFAWAKWGGIEGATRAADIVLEDVSSALLVDDVVNEVVQRSLEQYKQCAEKLNASKLRRKQIKDGNIVVRR